MGCCNEKARRQARRVIDAGEEGKSKLPSHWFTNPYVSRRINKWIEVLKREDNERAHLPSS